MFIFCTIIVRFLTMGLVFFAKNSITKFCAKNPQYLLAIKLIFLQIHCTKSSRNNLGLRKIITHQHNKRFINTCMKKSSKSSAHIWQHSDYAFALPRLQQQRQQISTTPPIHDQMIDLQLNLDNLTHVPLTKLLIQRLFADPDKKINDQYQNFIEIYQKQLVISSQSRQHLEPHLAIDRDSSQLQRYRQYLLLLLFIWLSCAAPIDQLEAFMLFMNGFGYGVTKDKISVRHLPRVDSEVVGTLAKHSTVLYEDNPNDIHWLKVRYAEQQGYVMKVFIHMQS